MQWFKGKKSEVSQKSVQEEMNEREIATQEETLAKYESERRATENDLDKCKDDIREVENALYLKRDEFAKANGNVRRLIKAEIQALAETLERQKGEQNLVLERLKQYDVVIAKLKETIQGLRATQLAKDAAELATAREEVEEQRKRNDAAIRTLERVGRRSFEEDDFDVDGLFARLESDMKKTEKIAEKAELEDVDAIIAKATRGASLETL